MLNTDDKFIEEYNQIVESVEQLPCQQAEWQQPGDYFKKLSMYENYTPVETSCGTVLTSVL